MSIFNTTDKLEVKGFINKNDILKYITEEQIFELVFGFQPKEFDYVVSPFRADDNPGCWFSVSPESGKLKFVDFGSKTIIRNTKMITIDCFDAVQIYYKFDNLYETLNFIREKLIKGKDLALIKNIIYQKKKKKETIINIETRLWSQNDKNFWSRYQISSVNLIEDKVFPVKRFKVLNAKNGDYSSIVRDICYAYTDFENSKKKLYRPSQKGKNKWISNCNQNDIGGINTLDNNGDLLLITKAYKDWRVLKNQGIKNIIWLQNEGVVPNLDLLIPLCQRFNRVVVFYDNDDTGIESSKKVSNIINNQLSNKSSNLYLPEHLNSELITDPGDFIWKKGKIPLNNFLYQNGLI